MTKSTLLSTAMVVMLLTGCKKDETAEPQYGTIGGTAWSDANGNAQKDATDPGVASLKVVLYDGAGTRRLDSTTTNATGTFMYDKLSSGTYKLRFTPLTGNVAMAAAGSKVNNQGWTPTLTIDVSKPTTDTLRVNRAIDAGFRAQTTYTKDVNVILSASCQPCHIEGGGANFVARVKHVNNYTNAKNIAPTILDRVSRAQGAAGMMPRNGTRLSEDRIATIKRWIEDGLAE